MGGVQRGAHHSKGYEKGINFHHEVLCEQWDKGAIIPFTGPKKLVEEGKWSVESG